MFGKLTGMLQACDVSRHVLIVRVNHSVIRRLLKETYQGKYLD